MQKTVHLNTRRPSQTLLRPVDTAGRHLAHIASLMAVGLSAVRIAGIEHRRRQSLRRAALTPSGAGGR
jgi:hypothetical protein